MLTVLIWLSVGAGGVVTHAPGEVAASSHSGAKYAPGKAVDGDEGTRWACGDQAGLPQWLEVCFEKPVTVDTIQLAIPVDHLYAAWKEAEVAFSGGEPVRFSLEAGQTRALWRFPARETGFVRVSVLSVYEGRAGAARHYVGVYEIAAASDPEKVLTLPKDADKALPREALVIRRTRGHPCVNVTAEDVARAKERIERCEWARKERDTVVAAAEEWLCESDEYWLSFLPEPGACYAYGFTGCPICGSRTGTWAGAYCSWDQPGRVRCSKGHVLPDEDHPDDGHGYTAPDGRIHYLVGQYNAWVTEQWTNNALPALSTAYLLTGDERYAARGALLLDALASIYAESTSGSWDYPSNPPSGRFARPWYQVARMLVRYVEFHDFLYNSAEMDKPSLRPGMTRRENIEGYLLEDGAYYCYGHSFSGALHNGHADYMRGALAVGCLLDVPEYVRIAVAGPYSIHAMLANNIDRDGRYYETALGYAIHARNLYLTFADPLYNLRSEEYPEGVNLYDDPLFESCMLFPELQVMLAGRMPNFGDAGPDVGFRPFPEHPFSGVDYRYLERLYARTTDTAKRRAYGAALGWLAEGDAPRVRGAAGDRGWLLWHAGDLPESDPALPPTIEPRVRSSWVAGMKGMAVLRGGDQAALVRFGPSLNHGDPDDLGLLYYANGREWTYDIGYGLGSTHTHVGWASSTVSHCLVTVNEANQLGADGSGGSLLFLGDLPTVKVVQATSENSYRAEGVRVYERTVALVDGAYLVDVFRVAGGRQHDFAFGSIGDDLTPFGVPQLTAHEGSLAEGYAWGQKILPDGDVEGYPNKPYWSPPPGNGYGFFYNVRRGRPEAVWGGTWHAPGDMAAPFRMHVAGDRAEAIFATAPGLYPDKPLAGYVIARRTGDDLESTFLAVYDPFASEGRRFDFNYTDLAHSMVESSAETKVMDSYATVLLKGVKAGDSMTMRLNLEHEPASPTLVVQCLQAPSYGKLQVEWDGVPVGEAVDLGRPTVQGPAPFEVGEVDASAGEHTITFRTAEAEAFYLGISGLQFGADAVAAPEPVVDGVRRIAQHALEVRRTNGKVDVLLRGPCEADCAYGRVTFDGDFAYLAGDGERVRCAEVVGCAGLRLGERVLDEGPAAFEAAVTAVDLERRAIEVDRDLPDGLAALVAVFSNPAYSRTTAYHVREAAGRRLVLHASTLSLGKGQVQAITDTNTLTSAIPHEYAKSVRRRPSSLFFDGKRIVGERGGVTRVVATKSGPLLELTVEDATVFEAGETFTYHDLAEGDTVRVALCRAHRF